MAIGPTNPKVKLEKFGGINVADHESKIGLGMFTVLENVDRSVAELRTRLGAVAYSDSSLGPTNTIKRMFRYRNSDSDKRILAYDGTNVYEDADDGAFTSVTSFDANADGSIDFTQYRDTVLMASENKIIKCYNSNLTPHSISTNFAPVDWTGGAGQITETHAGGCLLDKIYLWRLTLDYEIGADFVGETGPMGYLTGNKPTYITFGVDMTAQTGNDNSVAFKRPADMVVDAIPEYAARINFYRSPPLSALPSNWANFGYLAIEDASLFYVGSADMATVRAATAGDVIFTDNGDVAPGKSISFGVLWRGVMAQHVVMHKGRLWCGFVSIAPNETGVRKTYPDSIVYSRFFANGEEPLVFQTAAPKITLDHFTGEGITALGSWRGQVLVACKPNSTHAIYGGDDIISETIPNIQAVPLSSTIGCIAPRSFINAGDWLMWLSNEGPVIFDGRGVQELEARQVKPILDAIPDDQRRLAHSLWDSRNREWTLFFYRGQALRFNFNTRLWTKDVHQTNIGAALEIRDSDGQIRILRGIDDNPALVALTDQPLIETADSGFTNASTTPPIEWRAGTGSDPIGNPMETKEIIGVGLDGEWYDDVIVDLEFVESDGVGPDTATLGASLTFEPPTGGQGVVYLPFKDNRSYTGKRIKIKLHGQNENGRTHISSVSLYSPMRGERVESRV